MKFSTRTRYGLRILLQIAMDSAEKEKEKKKFIRGKEISRKQNITEPYLEQIMIPLKNARLVKTARGCFGGYTLAKKPADIKLLDIVELFEGPIVLADCVEDEDSCPVSSACRAHPVWKGLSSKIRSMMDSITLRDILSKEHRRGEYAI